MKFNSKIYFWYKSLLTEFIRVLILGLLLLLVIVLYINRIYPNFFIIPFGLFLIFEIYFRYKISRLMPKVKVAENAKDIVDSFTLEALSLFETQKNFQNLIKHLLNLAQVKFVVAKTDALEKDLAILDLDKTQLAQTAFNIAKELSGQYVTTIDLFGAYLLLIEEQTKFLFNRKLKPDDLKSILTWASNIYTSEESVKTSKPSFAGEGIAEDWVYGWTIETQKYMLDLTKDFLKNSKEPVGRENEYNQMTEALYKGGSVILVGDSGSGKESAVRQLAVESFMGNLKGNLYHQKIFQLMVDAFMAGAKTQGELEQRLTDMMQELAHSGNVIVYIPEFQNILGSKSFNLDISGAIIPYLSKGNIKIIAAVTPGAYKKFIEPMHSLLDTFTVINFSNPTKEEILNILFIKSLEIEAKNNISLSYKALLAASNFGQNYAKEKVMPGSAVVLLEDTANAAALSKKTIVEEQDVLAQIKKVVHVEVGEPQNQEKDLLLNLEAELHKKVIGQDIAVSAISESVRRLRSGLSDLTKPISFLFLGPTGVGKTKTAKTLADVYFGQSARLIRLDMSEFVGNEGITKLLGSPPGESDEKGILTEAIFDNPYSLILLDEFEKADKKVLDLFLQVFDDGRLTDSKGKTVSFVNSIIIATSNAASEYIRENEKNSLNNKNFKQTLLEYLQTKGIFKPELLSRFDDIIVFNPLSKPQITQIVKQMLIEFSKTLLEKDIRISFDPRVIDKIAAEGFDNDFGARPLRRHIQDNIEDLIAKKMLADEIKRGESIVVTIDNSGNIIITK